MQNTGVTIGLPVQSLPDAIGWYRMVLGSKRTVQPLPHILEIELSTGFRLQLVQDASLKPGDGVVRFGVSDLEAERRRLLKAGVDVSGITRHEGVISYCYVNDPYGNRLSLFQSLAP